MWLVRSLQLLRFQTLTSLSQPPETMTGFWVLGEKRTHETHSVWQSSVMVYLHSPRVFQSLMVLSLEPVTICLLSAEKETLKTSAVCPRKDLVVTPALRSQRRTVLSHEADKANWPSEEMARSWMKWLCLFFIIIFIISLFSLLFFFCYKFMKRKKLKIKIKN